MRVQIVPQRKAKVMYDTNTIRETNPVRVESQLNRAARKMRESIRAYRSNPNVGTAQQRRQKTLCVVSLRAKLALVSSYYDGTMLSDVNALRERYETALARKDGHLDAEIRY